MHCFFLQTKKLGTLFCVCVLNPSPRSFLFTQRFFCCLRFFSRSKSSWNIKKKTNCEKKSGHTHWGKTRGFFTLYPFPPCLALLSPSTVKKRKRWRLLIPNIWGGFFFTPRCFFFSSGSQKLFFDGKA